MRTKTRWILPLLLTALISAPGLALAWRAWNWHEVYPVNDKVWEVLSRPGSGPADFWCGAGDYALSVLRAPVVQRIYIWREVGASVTKPGYRSVQFAFEPPAGADTTTGYSLNIKRPGDNLTVAAARQYCFGGKFSLEDRWTPGW